MNNEKKKSKKSDDLPELEDVADVENSNSTVIYGLQGTGKTTLSASWPKPLLLLDFNDKGTDSISDVKGIKVAKIRSIEQLESVYWALKRGKWKFKTIVFDTVTRMQDMYIEDVSGVTNEAMSFGSLSRKQFGEVAGGIKKAITDFRDLDAHVVFLAQQKVFNIEEENEDRGDLPAEIGPALMPSVANYLNGAVNTIGQTYKRLKITKKEVNKKIVKTQKIQYCLYIGPSPVRMTKTRKPKRIVLPTFLIDPTYEELKEALKGE